eukprot:1157674-Pelagomonas_calceolata.AAC.2
MCRFRAPLRMYQLGDQAYRLICVYDSAPEDMGCCARVAELAAVLIALKKERRKVYASQKARALRKGSLTSELERVFLRAAVLVASGPAILLAILC